MKKLERHVAALEMLMAAGAAGVTAAIWLSIAGLAIPHGDSPIAAHAAAAPATATAMRYVTLPTVYVVGHAEAPRMTPTTTTAQNTATNPVTLSQ
jgi:hypothetical protein